jgi:hypothetical protein
MIVIVCACLISAQSSTAEIKQALLNSLQSSDDSEVQGALLHISIDKYVPEAIPIIEQNIWSQERNNVVTMLAVVRKYKSPNFNSLAHQALQKIDTIRCTRKYYADDVLRCKERITRLLFLSGDYSTYQFVFDLVEREKPRTFSDAPFDLADIIRHVPGKEDEARAELLRLLSLDNDESISAMESLEEIYGAAYLEAFKSLFVSTTNYVTKRMALNMFARHPSTDVLTFLKNRFLIDTLFSDDMARIILSEKSIEGFNFICQRLSYFPKGASCRGSIRLELECRNGPKYDTINTIPHMINNLSILIDTCYAYGWVGDATFMANLKSRINSAVNSINSGDSLMTAIILSDFNYDVYSAFLDTSTAATKIVKIVGWNFLYNNAEAILRILPAIPASTELSQLHPAIALTNSGIFTLEVTGAGFTSASKVLWNDSIRTTTFVSDSLLRASLLASDVATVGNKLVRVKYDSTSSAVSDSMVFSVVNTLPKPIRLVIEKEIDNHNGTMTAWFGYLNVNDRSVYIPVGDKNSFSPTPIDRGQATIFLPGRHKYVFGVTFPNTINIEWQFNGRRAKAGSVCEN